MTVNGTAVTVNSNKESIDVCKNARIFWHFCVDRNN